MTSPPGPSAGERNRETAVTYDRQENHVDPPTPTHGSSAWMQSGEMLLADRVSSGHTILV